MTIELDGVMIDADVMCARVAHGLCPRCTLPAVTVDGWSRCSCDPSTKWRAKGAGDRLTVDLAPA